jgi:hypothetical protein
MKKSLSLVGAVLLAFLASALVYGGFAISLRTYDSTDPRDASVPWTGFLLVTLGIGVALASSRIAAKFGAARPIENLVAFVFAFFGISGLFNLVLLLWDLPKSATRLPPAGVVWFGLAVLEATAALVWLMVKHKRERKSSPVTTGQTERGS